MFKTTEHNHRTRNNGNYDINADLKKIRGAFSDTAQDVRGKAGEILVNSIDGLKDQSAKIKEGVANYTSEKPFKSLGITLLAGVVIGYLLRK